MIKRTFQIKDMHCGNCAMRIEGIEDDLPGVKSVSASYVHGEMVVEYDESKVSPEAIIAAVKQQGYTAVLPERK